VSGFLLVLTPPAHAEGSAAATRSAARKLALEGIAALEKGDTEPATQKLDKSYRVFPVPSVGLWSARAFAKRGLLVEASERYRDAIRLPVLPGEAAVQAQSRAEAANELEALTPRIPTLLISVEGASPEDAQVTLDGVALPPALLDAEHPVNPGRHRVSGELAGQKDEQDVTLAEAEKKAVTLRFSIDEPTASATAEATKSEPPLAVKASTTASSARVLSYVTLSAGGVGLVLGGATGYLALQKRRSLDESDDCRGDRCLDSKRGEVDELRTLRTVSTVGFIAGGALVATGLVLTFSSGSTETRAVRGPAVSVAFAPNSASFSGTF
jgi:hypothetical protein